MLTLTGSYGLESKSDIRKRYIQAIDNSSVAEVLLSELATPATPMLLGYKGATEALVAKHAWNPYTKLSYLQRSRRTLNEAIRRDPNNPEIRFLRYSIQYYVPSWLGYSGNLKEDKSQILLHISEASPEVKEVIAGFLRQSGKLSPSELALLLK